MLNKIGKFVILIGVTLLGMTLFGDMTPQGGYDGYPPRPWERFDESLVVRTHSIDDLIAEASRRKSKFESISDEQKMMVLFNVVIDRFTHNEGARHTLLTNWLLYFAGKIHPTLGIIMDPEIFVAKGYSLICSQSSFLLMHMALREGIKARHVGLNGHVLMEAWYDDDWHVFDPDAEVVPRDDDGLVLSVEDLSQNLEVLKRAYPPNKGDFVHIISSREDNSFVSYPEGAYFEWKSQLLLHVEKAMQILKYVVSAFLVVCGLYIQRPSTNGL